MKGIRLWLLMTVAFALRVPTVLADTLRVPSEYPTIQTAIDAAVVGDVVEIADGTYTGAGNKSLNFGGKAITVRSASDNPALCIIDCEGDGLGFRFYGGEGPDSIVEGLAIINGSTTYGGGVYCANDSGPTLTNCTIRENSARDGGGIYCQDNSSPMLTDCTISGNLTNYYGGGLYCESGSPTLTNCTISGNSGSSGAGVCCDPYSSPTLTNCTISGNSADGNGGGVFCHYRSIATLTNCTISGNLAHNEGGGAYFWDNSPTLANCAINGNSAYNDGGGIYCDSDSDPTVISCTISGNLAYNNGGGVYCWWGSTPTLTNCAISGNSAVGDGGGVYFDYSSPTLTNCTLSGNSAYTDSAGVYCYNSSPTLANCILWANTPQEIYVIYGSPVVTCCDVQGGWSGTGNIDVDPLFAFADDLHLMPGSPCIDGGTNNPPGGLPADDLDGNARPLDGDGDTVAIADMGAYEFNPVGPSIALSPSRFRFSALEGGDDPADQMLLLRNRGTGTLNWQITGEPAWLTASPSSGQSSGEVDQVTLSVDISGQPHGVYSAVLEITDPQAVNSPREVIVTLWVGRTLHVPTGYPTIQAAIDAAVLGDVVEIADGTYTGAGNKNLDFAGKAITVRSASDDPALCIIDCEGDGRGFTFDSGEGSDSIVQGLTIRNGSTNYGGAVLCQYQGSPTLANCMIRGNSAFFGGGVGCSFHGRPTLANCMITKNTADTGGGVYCTGYSNATLTNCTISANGADHGGGVCCSSSSTPALTNCILWADTPQEILGSPRVTYCDVEGGWPGTSNIDADPLFSAGPGGCLYLSQTAAGPPFDSPCVDAGRDTAADLGLGGLTTRRDELGDTGLVDMGYHYLITGEPYMPGDIDRDGDRDLDDFELFAGVMTGPGPWPAGTITRCPTAGDMDDDGDLDLCDFAAFTLVFDPAMP